MEAGRLLDKGMGTSPGRPRACQSVAILMLLWQEAGSETALESLITTTLSELLREINETLRRRGIRDPSATDDALSLVLDHLRRLPGGGDGPEVAKFSPARTSSRSRQECDPGVCYLRQLARARASDVARARRRRHSLPFSALGPDAGTAFEQSIVDSAHGDVGQPPASERLGEAARQLEPRQRMVVELLLEGKSQALIAHMLGVNEGTVSRLRARAIASLRRLLEP